MHNVVTICEKAWADVDMSNIAGLFRRCGAGAVKASDLREEMRGHLEQLPDDEVFFSLICFLFLVGHRPAFRPQRLWLVH